MSLIIGLWIVMGVIAGGIASSKGRSFFAFFLYGALIWPVAIIHALVMKPAAKTEAQQLASGDTVKCPHCAELIKAEAKVCKHCGRDVEPALAANVAH